MGHITPISHKKPCERRGKKRLEDGSFSMGRDSPIWKVELREMVQKGLTSMFFTVLKGRTQRIRERDFKRPF